MRPRSSEGIALVAVLWVLVLLAVIAAAVMVETHSNYRAVRNIAEQATAEAVADAAIHRAIADLLEGPANRRWRTDGTPGPFDFEGRTVRISIQDQLGLVDLNY